ncbi:MAG: hypothetical protein EAZ89_08150 [Bacteroidetes bacterium]|nr:MAG: hypothetical protein EAZ89_08150 [Bacteroidota bacterium]
MCKVIGLLAVFGMLVSLTCAYAQDPVMGGRLLSLTPYVAPSPKQKSVPATAKKDLSKPQITLPGTPCPQADSVKVICTEKSLPTEASQQPPAESFLQIKGFSLNGCRPVQDLNIFFT